MGQVLGAAEKVVVVEKEKESSGGLLLALLLVCVGVWLWRRQSGAGEEKSMKTAVPLEAGRGPTERLDDRTQMDAAPAPVPLDSGVAPTSAYVGLPERKQETVEGSRYGVNAAT